MNLNPTANNAVCPQIDMHFSKKEHCNLAVVAIGNPVKESDRAGLQLVETFRKNHKNRQGICIFQIDNFLSFLGDIVKTHNKLVIVDAALFTKSNMPFDLVKLSEINQASLKENFQSSHGMSWLSEYLLARSAIEVEPAAYLFAVNAKSNKKDLVQNPSNNKIIKAFDNLVLNLSSKAL